MFRSKVDMMEATRLTRQGATDGGDGHPAGQGDECSRAHD